MATRKRNPMQDDSSLEEDDALQPPELKASPLGGVTGVSAQNLGFDPEEEDDLSNLGTGLDENQFDTGAMQDVLQIPAGGGFDFASLAKYLPAGISTLGSLAYMNEIGKTPSYVKNARDRYDALSVGGMDALEKDPSYLAALGAAQRQSAAGGWSGSNTEMQALMSAAGQSYDRALQRYADVGINSPTAQLYNPAVQAQQRMAALGNIAGDVGDIVALSGNGSSLTDEQRKMLSDRGARWRPQGLAAMGAQ